MKALISALIEHEKIKTTEAKAKEIAGLTEKFITSSKYNTLAARKRLLSFFSERLVKKMLNELGPRYKERRGGYTRIIKLGPRKSDGAKIAIIELVQ